MADGNLSLKEFWSMSEEDRCVRYGELSDHDKFIARCSQPSGPAVFVPCNVCVHRIKGKPACKAFPDGVSGDHIRAVMADITIECGVGYRFEKEPDDAD